MSYVDSIKIQIKDWVENTVKSEPLKFGGDDGNTFIQKEYLKSIHGIDLPYEAIQAIVSVSRYKNKFLEQNPSYDNRKKHSKNNKKEDYNE